jgi:acetyl esterase/lipase
LISPLYGELSGLPPVLIHAAQYDVFLSDSTRFAETAENAGVTVDIKVWRKMWHIFHMQAPFVPESKKALDEICSIYRVILP